LYHEYKAAAHLLGTDDPTGGARLFRPPKGYLDLKGAVLIRKLGLRTWLWTIDTEDWRPGISAEEVLAAGASAQSGDVILLHDGLEGPLDERALDRTATVAALPKIIETLRAKSLRFVTLSS